MQRSKPTRQPGPLVRRRSRFGFTLIELMMVIVIISILMSLVVFGLGAVWGNVTVAQVRTEISDLESALADFKATFGDYPPSHIRLYERGTGDPSWARDTTGPNTQQVREKSRAVIRRFWPQFDFNLVGPPRDFNADGDNNDFYDLTGAECLVFFLGGVMENPTTTPIPIGFSADPRNPFLPQGTNRVGPFFERFDAGRLVDVDGDQLFLEFVSPLDGQTTPYLYLAPRNGVYSIQNPNAIDDLDVFPNGDPRNMFTAYLKSPRVLTTATANQPRRPWNPNSFQIICAGDDDLFGPGGGYSSTTAEGDLTDADHDGSGGQPVVTERRKAEADNITNFAAGRLAESN